nr:MAG TPA: hypothetical protein [Caudoviricetes sp.]
MITTIIGVISFESFLISPLIAVSDFTEVLSLR